MNQEVEKYLAKSVRSKFFWFLIQHCHVVATDTVWFIEFFETGVRTMQFNIQSLGSACQLIQLNPVRMNDVAKTLGIEPVGYINGVPHFDVSDVERIAVHVRACERPTVIDLKPSF